jgi:hypothetical protein
MRVSGSTIAGRAPEILGHTVGMRRAKLRQPSAPSRHRAAVAAALLCLAVGCTGVRANSHYRYPRQVAYGRTSTCPDVRLPPLRDGNVSTDAARCSYADANGARVTHLAGKVLAEGGPGDPGVGVSAMKVTVHAVSSPLFDPSAPGPLIAHASTDAQGNYSLRGVFLPAQYAIVAHEPSGETIAYRVVRVEADAVGAVRDLHVMIPVDPRLKAEAAAPPEPRSDARLRPPPVTPGTIPAAPAAPVTPGTIPAAPATQATPAPSTAPSTTPATPLKYAARDPAPLKPPPCGRHRMRPPESGAAPRP